MAMHFPIVLEREESGVTIAYVRDANSSGRRVKKR
jgi:hypothetical protein